MKQFAADLREIADEIDRMLAAGRASSDIAMHIMDCVEELPMRVEWMTESEGE